MKRAMKSKEVKELLESVTFFELDKKGRYEIVDELIILMNGEPILFYHETKLIPALKLLQKQNFLKKIAVDMGAVPFVIKGADIMRPGIRAIDDDISKDDIVAVVDEKHAKALAVGKALLSTGEMRAASSGKVIKNIHYVGDKVWNSA
jgi:PUA-domain protein